MIETKVYLLDKCRYLTAVSIKSWTLLWTT